MLKSYIKKTKVIIMNEYISIIIIGIGALVALFCLFELIVLVRNALFRFSLRVLQFIVAIEYILLGYCFYSVLFPVYQLSRNSLFHKISTNKVMFEDSVYSVIILTFLLVSITAFNTSKTTFKQSLRAYVLFTVLSIVVVTVLNWVNDSVYASLKESTQQNGAFSKQMSTNFIFSIAGLLWLYFLSRFKSRALLSRIEQCLYNYLPITLLYLLLAITIVKPFIINKKETEHLLNVLGAYG